MSVEELKSMIRNIVREELKRQQLPVGSDDTSVVASQTSPTIDELADQIFEKYDDVFKALA